MSNELIDILNGQFIAYRWLIMPSWPSILPSVRNNLLKENYRMICLRFKEELYFDSKVRTEIHK